MFWKAFVSDWLKEQAIILHEAAARSLKAAGIAKLPNLAALQSEYEALQAQKEALYADYGKLKKKVREYDISEEGAADESANKNKRQKGFSLEEYFSVTFAPVSIPAPGITSASTLIWCKGGMDQHACL